MSDYTDALKNDKDFLKSCGSAVDQKFIREILLFGRTEVNIEDIPDEYYVGLLLEADAYVTKEELTPQEIIEKYSEMLTKEQIQLIYERYKI